MPYTREACLLFLLSLALALTGLGLLGLVLEYREKRKADRRERQLQSLNHREEMRRRHSAYLAQMTEVLESVDRGRSA